MSNCVVAGSGSPIVRAASRLTLRAPALRAAAASTQLAQWASGLSCGRQDVPADRTLDPRCIVTKHRVEDGDDLAHHGDEDNLGFLSGCREAIVEGSELGIATAGDQRRHVQRLLHRHDNHRHFPNDETIEQRQGIWGLEDQRRKVMGLRDMHHLHPLWQ
jgi:hypothetical protein